MRGFKLRATLRNGNCQPPDGTGSVPVAAPHCRHPNLHGCLARHQCEADEIKPGLSRDGESPGAVSASSRWMWSILRWCVYKLLRLHGRERHQSHVQRIVQSRRVEAHDRLHILYHTRYLFKLLIYLSILKFPTSFLNFPSRGAPESLKR